MSDEAAQHFDQQTQGPEETGKSPGRSISLTITLHPNGQLEMSGPIGNQILCYGLLGRATAHLTELSTMTMLKKAAAPPGQGLNGLLKKMGRG